MGGGCKLNTDSACAECPAEPLPLFSIEGEKNKTFKEKHWMSLGTCIRHWYCWALSSCTGYAGLGTPATAWIC